jgi:hypothetical protein
MSEQHVTVAQLERGQCYAVGLAGTLSELPGGEVVSRRDGSPATIWRVESIGRKSIDYRAWEPWGADGQGCWSRLPGRSRRKTWVFGAWFLPIDDPGAEAGAPVSDWQLQRGECYALNSVRNADGSLAVIWRVESIGPKWITYREWQAPAAGDGRGCWSDRLERTLRSGWGRGAPFVPVSDPGAWRPAVAATP